jgi:hypothetical protein
LTGTSTVASGAATMKVISSTSITSMNGTTFHLHRFDRLPCFQAQESIDRAHVIAGRVSMLCSALTSLKASAGGGLPR